MEEEREVVTEENPGKSAEVVTALTDLSIAEVARDLALEPIVTTTEEIKRPSIPEPGAPVVVVTEEAKTDDIVTPGSKGDEQVKDEAVPRGTFRVEMGGECLWCPELQVSNFVGSLSKKRKTTSRRGSKTFA